MNEDKDSRDLFLEEMRGVTRSKPDDRVRLQRPRKESPGLSARREAAVRLRLLDQNYLANEGVELLDGQTELAWRKDGVQHGVFRKLRLGQYEIEARLDLHQRTIDEARQEVWQFVRDCMRYEIRSVLIIHGRGDRRSDRLAPMKSYVNQWLKELPEVLAFHSAMPRHGGFGAVYVLLRKGEREKQLNRERFGSK